MSASATHAQTTAACQITGNIKGVGNQSVIFFYDWQGQQRRDTVRAQNDRFSYTAHPTDDGQLNLKIVPSRFTTIWFEPGQVTVTGSIAEPAKLTVTGTPENTLTTYYNQRINWKFEQRAAAHPDSIPILGALVGQATRAFIAAHPKARTSADLLYQEAKYKNDRPVAEYEQLLRLLSPTVQSSHQGQAVARRLTVLRSQPQIGQLLPTFTIPDTANVAVSLARFKGQYVLLDFWGHWCRPCIQSMPHLKQLQAQYAAQMSIVGIGMESAEDKPLWLKAIRKNQLTWTQLSELKADKGVIEQLHVEQFPTYMLLDKQGKLLVMASQLGPIEEKLRSLVTTP
ncbi:AhpC/TSA family protein [Hymenobacter sp. HSC-4F20]|uniref:TlpA disulfide reductase family protein n=1 Tax=Hymenobacter sp. HSC-4F20 TaxID=2864135 RepID=UPI001C736A6A|nr:TlpA disulfide reductase family protein [Hymenobacter sp. HSC-4F20]MBX0289558.1 AhpC/TSA family protein [Hymenobacter sp. HSC-4F20]